MNSGVPIPKGWSISQLVLHDESEDLSAEKRPFAGNIIVQVRMDARGYQSAAEVAATDLAGLQSGLEGFNLVSQAPKPIGNATAYVVELSFRDPEGTPISQLVLYARRGPDLYMISGTHRSGDRFARVREGVL